MPKGVAVPKGVAGPSRKHGPQRVAVQSRESGPTIHCIGDSHAGLFSGMHGLQPIWPDVGEQALPCVRAVRLGPFLAYSLTRPRHRARAALREALQSVKPGDRIVLCFGEIDCRCHVVRIAKSRGQTIPRAAGELAEAYVHSMCTLLKDYQPVFWCASPTTASRVESGEFPTVGTFSQRRAATRAFNAGVAREADICGAIVVDVSAQVSSRDGKPLAKYFPDSVHLGPPALPLAVRALTEAIALDSGARRKLERAAARLAKSPPPRTEAGADSLTRQARKLIERAARACARQGATQIALFGAGSHTNRAGLEIYHKHGLRVRAILDDRANGRMLGVPVIRPEDVPSSVRAVVISSDAHEDVLAKRARGCRALRNIPIVRIYGSED